VRLFRRKPKHPPREGWVVLLDSRGREVSERIPVVVNCDPLTFKVDHELTFRDIQAPHLMHVRVIDADCNHHDVALRP
jgi:hypothetical protein